MSPELSRTAPNPDRYVRAYVAREQADELNREQALIGLAKASIRRGRRARAIGLACTLLGAALGAWLAVGTLKLLE